MVPAHPSERRLNFTMSLFSSFSPKTFWAMYSVMLSAMIVFKWVASLLDNAHVAKSGNDPPFFTKVQ